MKNSLSNFVVGKGATVLFYDNGLSCTVISVDETTSTVIVQRDFTKLNDDGTFEFEKDIEGATFEFIRQLNGDFVVKKMNLSVEDFSLVPGRNEVFKMDAVTV